MPKTLLQHQAKLFADWGMDSQDITAVGSLGGGFVSTQIPSHLGVGQFDSIELEQLLFGKTDCCFYEQQHLQNQACYTDCGIYVILSGQFTFLCLAENQPIALNAPEIWLFQGLKNQLVASIVPACTQIQAFFVHFQSSWLQQMLSCQSHHQRLVLDDLLSCHRPFAQKLAISTTNHALLSQANQLFALPLSPEPLAQIGLQGQILSFVASVLQSPSFLPSPSAKLNCALWVKQFLDNHLDSNATIRQLAHLAYTNECYLKQSFKQLTGQSIGEYKKQQRMTQAVQLLAQNLSVADVAERLGYRSKHYFCQVFLDYHGYHPSRSRQR